MKYLITILLLMFFCLPVFAAEIIDADRDGISDQDEISVYKTDPFSSDTDKDGYSDWVELNSGYSPHNPERVKLEDNDNDSDGLSDRLELNFKTDLTNPDTDGDGYKDGLEVDNAYDPTNPFPVFLPKLIEINTGDQELYYYVGGVKLGEFKISSGKPSMPTPKGNFKIINQALKAWSNYGLWMPFWQGLGDGGKWHGQFGLHELPVWPNGYREGENHLGIPVSHGCVRLGIGPAELLYNWAEVGTPVVIY